MNKKYTSRLTAIILCVLTGCMSMDEMLASHDSAIHGRGEDRAVEELTDQFSESTLQEKLSLLKKVSDQKRLAKIYVGEHAAPEVKAAAVKRITDEDACLFIISEMMDSRYNRVNQYRDQLKIVSDGIKSEKSRLDAAYYLLHPLWESEYVCIKPDVQCVETADAIMADFKNDKRLQQYIDARLKLWRDYERDRNRSSWKSIRGSTALLSMVRYFKSCETLDSVERVFKAYDSLSDNTVKEAIEARRSQIEKDKELAEEAKNPPLYKFEYDGRVHKVWVSNGVIRITVDKMVLYRVANGGVLDFSKIGKRLPSSFFSLEGLRLGMTKKEVDFVKYFVWDVFRSACRWCKEFPAYEKTEVAKIFPGIMVNVDASNVGPSYYTAEPWYWNDSVYVIERRYSEDETARVGGYAGLAKRLVQKLGCKAHQMQSTSSDSILAPAVKPGNFDSRYDPYMIWELPEKDLKVELREIHQYDKTTIPVEPDRVRCDLLIWSLSLTKQKVKSEKAAAESTSAGF